MSEDLKRVSDWWQTEIIDMQPGEIRYRGYPIEQLIGNVGFVPMIWLMLRGELPSKDQADLLEAALMSAVDHGPQAPSIAIARMAVTCGANLNNAMASAVNVLDDIHGGAGEQAIQLYQTIQEAQQKGQSLQEAVVSTIVLYQQNISKYLPGFGHRFHPVDPRAPRLMELVQEKVDAQALKGNYLAIAKAIEIAIEQQKGRLIPMNIDGATAVIFAELGFAPELARGLFCLSRSVGILAHAWEQKKQGGRNKGPIPRDLIWTYTGEPERRYR